MKNVITGMAAGLVLILLLLVLYTVQGQTVREDEAGKALSSALENTAEQLTEERTVYENNEEFKAAFLQSLLVQMDSASNVKVNILNADCEKGILRAEVIETYQNPNGEVKSVSAERTILLERYQIQEEP